MLQMHSENMITPSLSGAPKIKSLQKNMIKMNRYPVGLRSIFRVEENNRSKAKTFFYLSFSTKQHSWKQIISLDVVILVYHKTQICKEHVLTSFFESLHFPQDEMTFKASRVHVISNPALF